MSYAAGYWQDVVLFGMLSTASWLFLVRCFKPVYFWRWAGLTFIVDAVLGLLTGQVASVVVAILGVEIIRWRKLGVKRNGRLLDLSGKRPAMAGARSE